MLKQVNAGVLSVAYHDDGPPDGTPVFLMHGFPYDVHVYHEVTPRLVAAGCRVITPYLRGYGPTRFLAAETLRSGQQAVLGNDLLALMDALHLQRAVVAGYDWGGRAACIVSALWPERVIGLVSGAGYNIQHIPGALKPASPDQEQRLWYQYYFHSERGRAGLAQNRYELCKLLWRLWSPTWPFDEATYARTAAAFDNPDFVDVVIHSYRHRYALVAGDRAVEAIEERLAHKPAISVPTVVLQGADNGVHPAGYGDSERAFFTGVYDRRVIPGVGHNLPLEAPAEFASAVLSLVERDPARA